MPPFITIPREYASDYRNRLITKPERDVLFWLRALANPYGIAVVDLQSLATDCLSRGSGTNYANKILLSLKRKRYIYYEERAGRRGSFEVHLDHWPVPNKGNKGTAAVKRITRYFEDVPEVIGDVPAVPVPEAEVDAELMQGSQRWAGQNTQSNPTVARATAILSVRPPDTDTDNKKEKYTSRSEPFKKAEKRDLSVHTFHPRSAEEEECLRIAQTLGEADMAFLLGSKEKHGMTMLTRAFLYCEQMPGFATATNKGAFFNKRLQEMVNSDNP